MRSNAHQSQTIGGMQVQTILKFLEEIQSNLGDVFPHSPLGFGTPVGEKMKPRQTKVEETDLWKQSSE